MNVPGQGGAASRIAPLAGMISGSGNPQAAPGGRGGAGRERAGGGGAAGRAERGGTQVRSGKFGSCHGFFTPRCIPAGVPGGAGRGVCRQVGVPGVRKAPSKVWERPADRRANSLAASMEKHLVCFVSKIRDEG